MEKQLEQVFVADNPWIKNGFSLDWPRRFIPDPFYLRHLNLSFGDRACLVIGPRQSGKSSLIWKTLADEAKPFLYLNCEEPAFQEWLQSPAAFLADLKEWLDRPVPLFFEEVQRLSEAGLFLKGIVDRNMGYPILATGSASFHLESATRESLAGRAERHLLLPFSLAEWTQNPSGPQARVRHGKQGKLEQMLVFGGYPGVLLSEEPERELAMQVESFIIRDASDRFRIKQPAAFRKVLQLAASQIGNLCNFSEWSSLAGVSNDTVSEYVHLLEKTHILRLVRPFVGGKRAELTHRPKVFFVDNGIRNQVFGGFGDLSARQDRGALVENFALSEILKSINPLLDSVRYWRTRSGGEVDFVIEQRGRLLAMEIKAGKTGRRLSRAARSFIEAYRPEAFLVIGDAEMVDAPEGVEPCSLSELASRVEEFVAN